MQYLVYFAKFPLTKMSLPRNKNAFHGQVDGMTNVKLVVSYLLIHYFAWFTVLESGEGAILKLGTPLLWKDSLPYLRYVRRHGVSQFIKKYEKCKDVECDELLWGDEIEYGIFAFDSQRKAYDLSCRTVEVSLLFLCEGSCIHR